MAKPATNIVGGFLLFAQWAALGSGTGWPHLTMEKRGH
jgi:hypothetical protein